MAKFKAEQAYHIMSYNSLPNFPKDVETSFNHIQFDGNSEFETEDEALIAGLREFERINSREVADKDANGKLFIKVVSPIAEVK